MTVEQLKEKFQQQIQMLQAKFDEFGADGWDLKEIVRYVGLCIMTLSTAIQSVDIPGTEKKRFIVEVVTDIYMSQDIDLPWIFEPFESFLEAVVLDSVVPGLVDILVDAVQE